MPSTQAIDLPLIMNMSSQQNVQIYLGVAVAVLVVARFAYIQLSGKKRSLPYPPGPKPLPLLGNLLQLPSKNKEKILTEWGKTYGDVIYARFLQTPVLIINSLKAAQDLLDKKSSKYSDRPQISLFSHLSGWGDVVVGIPYGDRFRKHRKWIHDSIGSKNSVKSCLAVQRREAYTLVCGLCDKPESFRLHINRFAAALLVEIGYGHTITSLEDMYVVLADKAMTETIDGAYLGLMVADFIPMRILKALPSWLPGYLGWFVKKASSVKAASTMMLDTPFQMVKDAVAAGTARPSLAASLLAEVSAKGDLTKEVETDIKGTVGVLYAAGTETTVSTLSTFFLAMVRYPEIFKKAREEIDRVVGTDRLPDFDDREELPYIDAILQETYRWGCPPNLGVFHRLMFDDEYRDYHIPAGSSVVTNFWAMTRDESMYPDPETFRPERYTEVDGETAKKIDPRNYIFGFGRRICPGRFLADGSEWLAMASVIASLDISKIRDAAGQEVTPVAAWNSGFINHPVRFVADIHPRSKHSADLIHQMSANAVL